MNLGQSNSNAFAISLHHSDFNILPIHLFHKYSLSTYSVPGALQGAGGTAVNKMGEISALSEGIILRGGWGDGFR